MLIYGQLKIKGRTFHFRQAMYRKIQREHLDWQYRHVRATQRILLTMFGTGHTSLMARGVWDIYDTN